MLTADTAGARTRNVAVPKIVESTVDRAEMLVDPAEIAVATPDAETVAIEGDDERHVSVLVTPLSAVTVAVYARVAEISAESTDGASTTARTRGISSNVTATDAVTVGTAMLRTVIVALPGVIAVTSPVVSTVALAASLVVHCTRVSAPASAVGVTMSRLV